MEGADATRIAALVEGDVDVVRLARLVEALALIDWRGAGSARPGPLRDRPRPAGAVPEAYAVTKLTFLGRPARYGGLEIEVRPDLTTLGLLHAGEVWEATLRAARRLRAAGVRLSGFRRLRGSSAALPDPALGRRLLAALLVPVRELALVSLVVEEGNQGEEEAG